MRRIVTSLAALSVFALGACSGGGTVLSIDNNTSAERTIVTPIGSGVNIARVLPGVGIPLSATGVRGTQNGYIGAADFVWSAQLTVGQSYSANALGQLKPCASVLYNPGGTGAVPFATDLGVAPYAAITIDPTNTQNIVFTPPPGIGTAFPLPLGAPPGSTITANTPYCVTVSAYPRGKPAAVGSITVAVVNPLAPEQ